MNGFPSWLKKRIAYNPQYLRTKAVLGELGINTVCQNSLCPNINECFSRSHATFMILGNVCSRRCGFCAVSKGRPREIDTEEPLRIREAVLKLSLRHVIITSVTRDDLDDGGASQFAKTIGEIRKMKKDISVEVLTPDFQGKKDSIERVAAAGPDIFGHNIETVPRLYKAVRPDADYNTSLNLLKAVKEINPHILTKSGLMLGLGEKEEEVLAAFDDLKNIGCDMLTLGQYLRPGKDALRIRKFIQPSVFSELKEKAFSYGFKHVESGPFVRSSYYSEESIFAVNSMLQGGE